MILLFNGPSSSGKSSLIKKLKNYDRFWFSLGVDLIWTNVNNSYTMFGENANKYFQFIESTENNKKVINLHMGPLGRTMIRSFTEAVNIFAKNFNMLIDEVIENDFILKAYLKNITEPCYLIGMHCSLDTLIERENNRKNRPIGLAQSQYEKCHKYKEYYDLNLDGQEDIDKNIEIILNFIDKNAPKGFTQLQRDFNYEEI
jgi:chloramphenicol 3-O-phosphotransferase